MTPSPGPGEQKLRAAIHRQQQPARQDDPCPYDNDWGWWIDKRLHRLEHQIRWIIALAASALAAEVLRILLAALGLLP